MQHSSTTTFIVYIETRSILENKYQSTLRDQKLRTQTLKKERRRRKKKDTLIRSNTAWNTGVTSYSTEE